MAPFAAYLRVSRVGDRKDTLISPELQQTRIHEYARARAIEVVDLAPELDVSGSRLHRPVLDRILSGIESGEFGGLIVAQLDRLSRMGIVDTLGLIDRIESLGGTFISCAENIDASTRSGKLTRNLFSSIAEHELDRYREQFREAKERAVKAGVWPSPKVPLGYLKAQPSRRLAIDPDGQHRVRAAFEARAAGLSWSEVAHLLGTPMSTARKIVHSRVYLGEVKMGEFRNRTAHPPIVDRALWEAAQVRHPATPRGKDPALLSGLVRCAGCQGRMTARRKIYICQARPRVGGRCAEPAAISRPFLEDLVQRTVSFHLQRVEVEVLEKTDALKEAQSSLGEAEAELVEYQEVARVVGQRDSFLAGMRVRIEAVEVARKRLANTRVAVALPAVVTWDGLSLEEKRHVLGSALGVVFVKKGRRVRILEGDFDPPVHGAPVVPLGWDNLEGELRMPGDEDF